MTKRLTEEIPVSDKGAVLRVEQRGWDNKMVNQIEIEKKQDAFNSAIAKQIEQEKMQPKPIK